MPNDTLVCDRLTAGPAPVPVRVTLADVWELLDRLTSALNDPDAAGVKVTLMVHVAAAARLVPQLFVSAKALALVPRIDTLSTLSARVPVLVSTVVCAVLVFPTAWAPKLKLLGEKLAEVDPPEPLRWMS